MSRGTRGDGAHGGVGARRHGVDDVLGHDAEIERDRDHVSDRDHHVASCFESLARAVEIFRLGEGLDHPDVVADSGAHHPSNGGDRNRADDREPTERALQHRNDDQESAPEDRGEGRDRGARDRPDAGKDIRSERIGGRLPDYFGASRLYLMRWGRSALGAEPRAAVLLVGLEVALEPASPGSRPRRRARGSPRGRGTSGRARRPRRIRRRRGAPPRARAACPRPGRWSARRGAGGCRPSAGASPGAPGFARRRRASPTLRCWSEPLKLKPEV